MAIEQRQAYCHYCKQMRLHTRNRYDVPHVIHLIIVLFLLGGGFVTSIGGFGLLPALAVGMIWWVPGFLWLLLWLLHMMANAISLTPFLCTQCGQREGAATAEEIQQARWKRKQKIKRAAAAVSGFLSTVTTSGWRLGARGVAAYDHGLRRIAGEENALIYRFLQWLSIAAVFCAALVGTVLLAGSLKDQMRTAKVSRPERSVATGTNTPPVSVLPAAAKSKSVPPPQSKTPLTPVHAAAIVESPPSAEHPGPIVGESFTIVGRVIGARTVDALERIAMSIGVAGDETAERAVLSGMAEILTPGTVVVPQRKFPATNATRLPFAECTVRRDGTSPATMYLMEFFFDQKHMNRGVVRVRDELPPDETDHTRNIYFPEVGDKFESLATVAAVSSPIYVPEYTKVIKAHDSDGMKQMLNANQLAPILAGDRIVVLEVHRDVLMMGDPAFIECRVSRKGEEPRKAYVLSVSFTKASFKPMRPGGS